MPIPPPQAGPQGYAAAPFRRFRVSRNLQPLAVLWSVYAAYRFLFGLIGFFFVRTFALGGFSGWPFDGHVPAPPHFPPGLLAFILPIIGTVTVISVALSLAVAFGLLQRRRWGRTVAIVASILALFKFPLGTALGIYTLWVLAPGESGVEYDSITAPTYSA